MDDPVRLTIDTNCVNAKSREAAMNTLERWAEEGKVQLDGSLRFDMETKKYARAVPARSATIAAKTGKINDVSEPANFDASFLDESYCDGEGPDFEEIASVLFPSMRRDDVEKDENKANDVMHLVSHASGGGSIFVTKDEKDFIKGHRRDVLKDKWGIVVMTPDEAVEHLRGLTVGGDDGLAVPEACRLRPAYASTARDKAGTPRPRVPCGTCSRTSGA